MKNVFIATSRDAGRRCSQWAERNTPRGFKLTENKESAHIVISVMYDTIFTQEFLESRQCYNFHPGVLPAYKGVGIFSWVLMNEEEKAGVTLHKIDAGVDTGEVIEIREFLISEEDTAYSLFLRGEDLIFKMFKDWYCDILEQNYIATPQRSNPGKAYSKKDLQKAKNLTKYAKAFYFPNKENAFYFNSNAEKVYIAYKESESGK
mgnify:CR=1 FL=1